MEAVGRPFPLRLTVFLRNQAVWWHLGMLEVRLLSIRCQHVHSAATCPFCCFSDDLLCGLLIPALYKIALNSVGRWVGLWANRCFEGVEWCWEVPSAAWGEACRPLGLVLSAANPVSYAVHLGIDSVPPNGVDGRGEVFWGVNSLQGHGKGAWQCPVCPFSCPCSCLLLISLTRTSDHPTPITTPRTTILTILTTAATIAATRTTTVAEESSRAGGWGVWWAWGCDGEQEQEERGSGVQGAC